MFHPADHAFIFVEHTLNLVPLTTVKYAVITPVSVESCPYTVEIVLGYVSVTMAKLMRSDSVVD